MEVESSNLILQRHMYMSASYEFYIQHKNNIHNQTSPSKTVMGWSNCHAKDHENIYGYITVWNMYELLWYGTRKDTMSNKPN